MHSPYFLIKSNHLAPVARRNIQNETLTGKHFSTILEKQIHQQAATMWQLTWLEQTIKPSVTNRLATRCQCGNHDRNSPPTREAYFAYRNRCSDPGAKYAHSAMRSL